jgi:hypothetical protein
MQTESQRVGTSARLDALAVSKRVFFSEFIQSRTHCGDTILHQCFVGHWTGSVAGTAGILKWSLLSRYTTFTPILHHEGRRCRPQEDIENRGAPLMLFHADKLRTCDIMHKSHYTRSLVRRGVNNPTCYRALDQRTTEHVAGQSRRNRVDGVCCGFNVVKQDAAIPCR